MATKKEMINELGSPPVRTSSLSSDNDPPRPCFLARTSRCETNLHHLFWESSSSTAQRTRTTTTFEDLGSSSDVDTESTASESDSPNSQDYYSDYNSASTQCLPRRKQQSSLQSACCASHDPFAGTNYHRQGILAGLKETLGLRGGIVGGISRSPYEQATAPSIKMEDTSSTTTTIGHHRRTTQRSSNIPVQRLTRGGQHCGIAMMSNCDDSSDVAEKALQAQLQAHYTMRTWDMYHRITQSRKKTTCSPAMAASIDCLLQSSNTARSSPHRPFVHQQEPVDVSPTHMMDTMLDQEMLFPLDD